MSSGNFDSKWTERLGSLFEVIDVLCSEVIKQHNQTQNSQIYNGDRILYKIYI